MFLLEVGRPNDRRRFVHKRLLGGIKGFIGGGPLGALGGFLGGGQRRAPVAPAPLTRAPILVAPPVRRPVSRTITARPSLASAGEKELGRAMKFGNGGENVFGRVGQKIGERLGLGGRGPGRGISDDPGCILPWRRDRRTGECRIFAGEQTGVDPTPVGEAVMGQYGAALAPGNMVIDRAVCLRGMQLGNDGLCYNSGAITNKQRMWPAGRKPLLTGGEMSAISTAARAGRRLELATKRLQRLGMMKKPSRRAVPAGHVARVRHE